MTIQDITEDDIYNSTVSDNSFGRGNSPCLDAQQAHALPYEIAVFHNQNQAVDTQKPQQDITDSKSALKSNASDEVDDKHNQHYRENINDEHHVYDEVQHKLKEEESCSSVKVLPLINDRAKRSIKESVDDSEPFDDVVYSSRPSQNYDTRGSARQPNADMRNQHSGEGSALSRTSTKLTRKQSEYETPETVATKEQLNCSDEHIYHSADQISQGQTKPQVIPIVSGERINSPNGAADKKVYVYHTLESQESSQEGEIDPNSHALAANVSNKSIQYESAECSSIQYSCQFDDPMYESTIQLQANPQVTISMSSMKADLVMDTELHEKGNPDVIPNCDGDAENFTDAPQHSDPTDSESMGTATVQDVLDKQDKGNANLASIYDIFDDPTYGVSHAGSNRGIIH